MQLRVRWSSFCRQAKIRDTLRTFVQLQPQQTARTQQRSVLGIRRQFRSQIALGLLQCPCRGRKTLLVRRLRRSLTISAYRRQERKQQRNQVPQRCFFVQTHGNFIVARRQESFTRQKKPSQGNRPAQGRTP